MAKNIACDNCGNEISKKAPTCPKCGHPNKKASELSGGTTVMVLGLLGFGIWWLINDGDGLSVLDAGTGMDSLYQEVIDDSLQQYVIAKKQGDPIQTCVQAGLVSASYLQAKDTVNYEKWKKIEVSDCK